MATQPWWMPHVAATHALVKWRLAAWGLFGSLWPWNAYDLGAVDIGMQVTISERLVIGCHDPAPDPEVQQRRVMCVETYSVTAWPLLVMLDSTYAEVANAAI
jgi:hypothetical protein